MGLKTILVCLTTPEHAETLMKQAVQLARRHNAHLIGLHTLEALVIYPGIAVHIPEEVVSNFKETQNADTEVIKAVFEKHTRNEDFPSEFRLLKAKATSANERIVQSARAADLVMMAQPDKDADRYDQRGAQAEVIRASGRPVIVVPLDYEGPAIGENIVLGWSDTREAARAAHDLLSVADSQASVTVLRVGPLGGDPLQDSEGIDISDMLARHGLKTTLDHRDPKKQGIAEVMTEVVFEKGADLIVTGAFGHSKAYDFVIGATTYALLRDATVPVLFSK